MKETLPDQNEAIENNHTEEQKNETNKDREIDYKELAYRYAAEIDNIRKRAEREIKNKEIELENKFVNAFVPVLSDIYYLINNRNDSASKMIQKKIDTLFEKFDLKPVPAKEMDFFSEYYHECVATIETDSSVMNNKIATVVQQGYMYKDRVVKPAYVIVYKYKGS